MNWNEFFDIDTLRNGMPNSCPHNSFTYTWLFLLAPNRFNTIFPGLSWELVYGNRALICIFISGLCKLSLVFVCHSRGNSCFFYFRQNNHQGWPSTTNFRSFQKPSHRFRRRKYPLRKIQLVRKNAIFEARSIYHAFFPVSIFFVICLRLEIRKEENIFDQRTALVSVFREWFDILWWRREGDWCSVIQWFKRGSSYFM